MNPPIHDDGPLGGRPFVQNQNYSRHYIGLDVLAVHALTGALRFEAAAQRLRNCDPAVFRDRVTRTVAAALLTGHTGGVESLHGDEREQADWILWAVEHATEPADEAWALHLVRALEERENVPLLAAQLTWAASEVLRGAPVRWIQARVQEGFDIAGGTPPSPVPMTSAEVPT